MKIARLFARAVFLPAYLGAAILDFLSVGHYGFLKEIEQELITDEFKDTTNYQAIKEDAEKEQSDHSTTYWQKRFKNDL